VPFPVQNLHSVAQAVRAVMGVPLGHHTGLVPEQPLHFVEVHAGLNEPRGEGVPQIKIEGTGKGKCIPIDPSC